MLFLPHSTYSSGWVEGCSGHHIPLGAGARRDSVSTQVSVSIMAEKRECRVPLLLSHRKPEQATHYLSTTKEAEAYYPILCLERQLEHLGLASVSAANHNVSGSSLATTKPAATRVQLSSELKETDTVLPIRHFKFLIFSSQYCFCHLHRNSR